MSDIDPADLTFGRPAVPERFDEDDTPDESAAETTPKKAEREGLPPNYRMRADAHYVEALTSRRSDRAEAGRAARRAEPEIDGGFRERRDARDRVDRLVTQLTEDLATIESAAGLLAGEPSKMARRANVDLIRAQAWRASCLLRATAIVDGTHRPRLRPRPLGFVLGQIRSGFTPEARLTGAAVDVRTADWNAVVAIDEPAFLAAVAGGIFAVLGLLGQTDDARVTVTAETNGSELRTVEIAQDELAITPSVSARFFDASWADRPGGWTAGLGAAAAKAAAELHGGDAVFLAAERFGSVLRLSFSAQK